MGPYKLGSKFIHVARSLPLGFRFRPKAIKPTCKYILIYTPGEREVRV